MYLNRTVDKYLQKWKHSKSRKPILLRGARQVGKSSSVKALGATFENFVELNFESQKSLHEIFEGDLNIKVIIENISVLLGEPIAAGKTLLFLDEIQACPNAIASLRYFYEQMPDLHVIAAGSLLEFALEELPSFGVGRIHSVQMYPLSFNEFLLALDKPALVKAKAKANKKKPLNKAIHEKLLNYYKQHLLLGGMPEVIKTYIQEKDALKCQVVLDDLITSYYDDFAKYKKRVPASRIREVLNSVVMQNGGKFNYSKTETTANHKQIKEAINLLIKAGIVIPVTHTSANGIPLGAEVNIKKRKMLLLDTGLFLRLSDLEIKDILFADNIDLINKGGLTELFFGLDWLKEQAPNKRTDLYYWSREKYQSNAEVDFVIQKNGEIIPIEIKSGRQGKMQSMWQFLKLKKRPKGIRATLENFGAVEGIDIYPVYAVSEVLGD